MLRHFTVLESAGLLVALALSCAACGTDPAAQTGTPESGDGTGGGSEATGGQGSTNEDQGAATGPVEWPPNTDIIPDELKQSLSDAAAMSETTMTSVYAAPAPTPLGYDTNAATGLDLIQSSSLALNDAELAALSANGLVISKRVRFPSFSYGYKTIYAADLPVYVSADSLLEAVHRNFDHLLKSTEAEFLMDDLGDLLTGMRARLHGAFSDPQLTKDLDLYLTVAASLLEGAAQPPEVAENVDSIANLFALATAASGHSEVELFGVARDEDFSQFKPRGHYTDTEVLSRYFRAMMWLGRVDLRIIETQFDGSQVFNRRQFDAAVALRQLMGDWGMPLWQTMDTTIGAFAGEHDSMTPKDMGGLMQALGVTTLSEADALSNQQIVDELIRGGWGQQRIASRIITNGTGETLPQDRSFLIFGQRYTVDSHTFVNVTFDRVADRAMPNPLDVAFAALGNDSALSLLAPEFGNESYVRGLAQTRVLVDAHEDDYWNGSLYTRWLGVLRTLSPSSEADLPGVPATLAWQKRILATQLGSWAELRHDTILYAKQSYATGFTCEFPDAYVDPYPELYARLGAFADAVGAVSADWPDEAASLRAATQSWAAQFKTVMTNLGTMAQNQLTGTPHSEELLAFINEAVRWDEEPGCGDPFITNTSGWYFDLYINRAQSNEYDPTVADVHTQPTDEGGNDVGRILHVGTGRPRLMVVTAETCEGPRAYAGLAMAYGELITEDWARLTDEEWSFQTDTTFPDVAWMSDVAVE